MKKPGRPEDPVRAAWMERFQLHYIKPCQAMRAAHMCQLSLCKSDEARRLILGVSK